MNDLFYVSKLLIKRKLKVLTDSEKLELEGYRTKYSFLDEVKIGPLVDKIDKLAAVDNRVAWKSIKLKQQDRYAKPAKSKKMWFAYAAAAVLVSLLTTPFFLQTNSSADKPLKAAPQIVRNTIDSFQAGTDKAILTLANGERISLEKGASLKTKNAKSNGEEIVYESTKQYPLKLVYNYLTIPRGGQFMIKLADGTKVWLNSESQLKFPVAFIEGKSRVVELVYGEAYFEVSPSTAHKGAPFEVLNTNQKVEVVGTEFNIKAYKDEFNIYTTLINGKVNIEIDNKKQKLVPNQQLNLNTKNSSSVIRTVDVKNEISWKDGVFVFKGKSLKEIMKVISRWYDVNVIFEDKNLEVVEFKGSLDKTQSLKEILSIMKSTTINNYEIKDKTLIIR